MSNTGEMCAKKKDHFDGGSLFTGFIAGFLIGSIVVGKTSPDISFSGKREAVKHGAAVWTTTEEGDTEWKWKDEVETKPLPVSVDPSSVMLKRLVDDMERFLNGLKEELSHE